MPLCMRMCTLHFPVPGGSQLNAGDRWPRVTPKSASTRGAGDTELSFVLGGSRGTEKLLEVRCGGPGRQGVAGGHVSAKGRRRVLPARGLGIQALPQSVVLSLQIIQYLQRCESTYNLARLSSCGSPGRLCAVCTNKYRYYIGSTWELRHIFECERR